MKKSILLIGFTLLITVVGCASTTVKKNSNYQFPIAVSANQPALIFPMTLHGVPGNRQQVGLAISTGILAKQGVSVISAQQLYDLVGNLSYTVGENIRKKANKGNFELKGRARKVGQDLKFAVEKLSVALNSTGVKSKFNRVIVLHVDSNSGLKLPGMDRVIAFGGIVDLDNLQIISFIEKELTLVDDKDTVLKQMPIEMNLIVDELIGR